jgi:hypothetical protein
MFTLKKTLVAALVACACVSAQAQFDGRMIGTRGTMCTCDDADGPIYDTELAEMIGAKIPDCVKKLLVFTQCYGGDFLDNFAGDPNTAATSANEPGKPAYYGGYDDDAAAGLRPGAGRTAGDMHGDASAPGAKDPRETPQTGGGLPVGGFPLDPVGTNGISSRHILFYAGKPNAADDGYLDTIRDNFAGEANTTVRGVGGAPGHYDHPGTHKGLQDALDEIAAEIAASPSPCREQFILFVSDHGDLHTVNPTRSICPPFGILPYTLPGYQSPHVPIEPWLWTPDNITSLSVWFPLGETGELFMPGAGRYIPNGQFRLRVTTPSGMMTLSQSVETYVELDGFDVGNRPMEGVRLSFRIPENLMIDSFFDVFVNVELMNFTPRNLVVRDVSLDSGSIQKGISDNPHCRADFNRDGVIDFFDYDDFILCFELGICPPGSDADFNNDGSIDFFDYDDFVIAFEQGC